MRRLGCRPTRQACRSRAPLQQATLSATTWREGPFPTIPTPPSSPRGQPLQLRPPPSPAWPRRPTMAPLRPWPPRSAWAPSWGRPPCFATLPSSDPILAGLAASVYTAPFILTSPSFLLISNRTRQSLSRQDSAFILTV